MSLKQYADRLAYFRENEKPAVVLLIADDLDLIRIIVAWTNTTVTRSERETRR